MNKKNPSQAWEEIQTLWHEASDRGIMGLDENGDPKGNMERIDAAEEVVLDAEFAHFCTEGGGVGTTLSVTQFDKNALLLALCFCRELSTVKQQLGALITAVHELKTTR